MLFTNCVRFRCHNDVNGFEAVGAWGINNWPAEERIDFVLCLAGIPDCVARGKGRL